MANRLTSDTNLERNESLTSSNGHFRLIMQGDGNLVLYDTRYNNVLNASTALWSSRTAGEPVARCRMQGDGNLVLYDSSWHAIWATNTEDNPGAIIELKNSGNLEINKDSSNIWETETIDPRLWTPSNFPLTFSDTHVVNGKLTAEIGEHGIGWIEVKGTHAGAGGSSKFGGRIALADSLGSITWMSNWVTVTVGADVWDQENTNRTRRDLEVPQDRIKLSVKGKTFLWRDPEPWINGRFDQEIIKLVERAEKVYKTIKDSEMWKDYEKSQVGESAPSDPPPTYELSANLTTTNILRNSDFYGTRQYWDIAHHDEEHNAGHNEAIYPFPPPGEGYYFACSLKSEYTVSLQQDVDTPHEAGNQFKFTTWFRVRGNTAGNVEFAIWELGTGNQNSSGRLNVAPSEEFRPYEVSLIANSSNHPFRCEVYMRTQGVDFQFDKAEFKKLDS